MADTKAQPLLTHQKTLDENSRRCALSRRILAILTIQMLCFLTFITVVYFVPVVQTFLLNDDYKFITAICWGVVLIVALVILCAREFSKKKAVGYILLVLHTLAFTYLFGYFAREDPKQFFLGIINFAVVTFILNLYACLTKTDYTLYGAGLYVIVAVIGLFCGFYYGFHAENLQVLYLIYGSLAVLIYSLYVIFEIQLITSGKRYDVSESDFVIGSLLIYADILYLGLLVVDLITNIND